VIAAAAVAASQRSNLLGTGEDFAKRSICASPLCYAQGLLSTTCIDGFMHYGSTECSVHSGCVPEFVLFVANVHAGWLTTFSKLPASFFPELLQFTVTFVSETDEVSERCIFVFLVLLAFLVLGLPFVD
jgi:hypothetical protein